MKQPELGLSREGRWAWKEVHQDISPNLHQDFTEEGQAGVMSDVAFYGGLLPPLRWAFLLLPLEGVGGERALA